MIDTGGSRVTATVRVGDHPYCATVSPDGTRIYVTNTHDDSVSVIDANANQVVATVPVDSVPEGIAYAPASHRIYVASWGDNTVSVIDANSNKRLASIPTGKQSRAFGQFVAAAPH
ncbi:hypothetical protein GALL_359330 [mine drainage metagenome]|uniref:Uncharacterized protein n=1 Tax=mine drainage metagenome TaxID=410659 RepID=A0A1J5QQU5_9ZZZZ